MRSPRRKKRPWTAHEICLYLALVWRQIPLPWAEIARRIGSRSPQQIRSRDEYVRRKVVQALCASEDKPLGADLPTTDAIAARLRPDELRGLIPDAKLIELYGASPTGSPATGLARMVDDSEVLTPPRTPVSSMSLDTVNVDGATSTVSSDIDDIGFLSDFDIELASCDDWERDLWLDNDELPAGDVATTAFPAEIQTS